ncbi:MAG TPA: hypothetical protein PK559_04495 [Ignavibacteriaceae bacterium]|nr:hypothetical protein [Ignavibacteriaceae bacterium]
MKYSNKSAEVEKWFLTSGDSLEFNASKLSSGVYLYELRSNEYKSTKKLLLMK